MEELEELDAQIRKIEHSVDHLQQQQNLINRRLDHTGKAIAGIHAAVNHMDQTLSAQVEINKKQLSVLKHLYQQNKIIQEQRMERLEERLEILEDNS